MFMSFVMLTLKILVSKVSFCFVFTFSKLYADLLFSYSDFLFLFCIKSAYGCSSIWTTRYTSVLTHWKFSKSCILHYLRWFQALLIILVFDEQVSGICRHLLFILLVLDSGYVLFYLPEIFSTRRLLFEIVWAQMVYDAKWVAWRNPWNYGKKKW